MRHLKIIGFLLIVGILSSCSSDDEGNPQNLNGVYSESLPMEGRSQLNFIDDQTVVISEPGNASQDEFTYEVVGNLIKLTPTWDNTTSQEFEIEIINDSKFEIENLYPSIPEAPTSYMTFVKQ